MDIYVGTTSKLKLDALKAVLSKFIHKYGLLNTYKLYPKNVSQNFSETPYGRETYILAKKRALLLYKEFCDINALYIGIESGLTKRNGVVFEECWSVVIRKKDTFSGYSSGIAIPKIILQEMEKGYSHSDILYLLNKEKGIQHKETWGAYTNMLILRQTSIAEACRNSLLSTLQQ